MEDRMKPVMAEDSSFSIDQGDVAFDSVALNRIMQEVRVNETAVSRHYNRQHNRHNR